jgi:hypothetical protein
MSSPLRKEQKNTDAQKRTAANKKRAAVDFFERDVTGEMGFRALRKGRYQ